LFANLEDGLNDIDCEKTEYLTQYDAVIEAFRWLAEEKHEFQYLAIDSVDWLEKLIHHVVADAAQKKSIADIGYGAGYKQALQYWDRVTEYLDWLRNERGMGVILLAHADIRRFESPEQDSYDRYQPALHPSASSLLQEWSDEVLFASYRVFVRQEDQGFNKSRTIAASDGERYVRTQESAAVQAKNRLGMPTEIPFTWEAYAQFITAGLNEGNIAGQVKDGTSKA